MSFDDNYWSGVHQEMESLNPFRSGQCLSTVECCFDHLWYKSQSLSIRAMSFDEEMDSRLTEMDKVSIPFDQGNVFRLVKLNLRVHYLQVSIPFDQGNVFRQTQEKNRIGDRSQSLSIRAMSFDP